MELRRVTSENGLPPPASGHTIVVKVGTSSLVRAEQNSFNLSNLARICETVRDFYKAGHRVVVVSSGAIAVGCKRLGLPSRPSGVAQKQALAAVGQVHLMRFYDDFFSALGVPCAQVLLTQDNLGIRSQYLNARNTFTELFAYGTVPIVNENDTVAVEQVRFGDNDTLAAQVATLVQADWLFLLTDVPALYTANPNTDSTARPIHEVNDIAGLEVDTTTKGTQWGTGGMATKLTAARLATASGCRMAICLASEPERMAALLAGDRSCSTVFHPHPNMLRGKLRWILSVAVKGTLWIDNGALAAVLDRRKSLFAAGIIKVEGRFDAQDAVRICDAEGREVGRALVNYCDADVRKVKGMSSRDFEPTLGWLGSPEIAHRDNIGLVALQHSPHRPGGVGSGGSLSGVLDRQTAAAAFEPASASARQPAAASAATPAASDTSAAAQPQHLQQAAGCTGGAPAAAAPDSWAATGQPAVGGTGTELRLQDRSQDLDSVLPADDVHAEVQQRLRVLQMRPHWDGTSAEAVGDNGSTNWQAALAQTIAAEQAADAAAAQQPQASPQEDIDEGGWLPK